MQALISSVFTGEARKSPGSSVSTKETSRDKFRPGLCQANRVIALRTVLQLDLQFFDLAI